MNIDLQFVKESNNTYTFTHEGYMVSIYGPNINTAQKRARIEIKGIINNENKRRDADRVAKQK